MLLKIGTANRSFRNISDPQEALRFATAAAGRLVYSVVHQWMEGLCLRLAAQAGSGRNPPDCAESGA